jgi:hypothetical protein
VESRWESRRQSRPEATVHRHSAAIRMPNKMHMSTVPAQNSPFRQPLSFVRHTSDAHPRRRQRPDDDRVRLSGILTDADPLDEDQHDPGSRDRAMQQQSLGERAGNLVAPSTTTCGAVPDSHVSSGAPNVDLVIYFTVAPVRPSSTTRVSSLARGHRPHQSRPAR